MSNEEPHNYRLVSEHNHEEQSLQLLELATWNIRGFARPDCVDLAEVLKGQPLALVVVQELQRSQAKRLAGLLGMHQVWSFKHSPLGPFVRFAEGLALLSVEPLSRVETLELTEKVKLYTHRRRVAQFAYLSKLDTDVVNIHLASHANSSARMEQLQKVLAAVRSRNANRCILAGDFNAENEQGLFRLLESGGFSDAWTASNRGNEIGATGIKQGESGRAPHPGNQGFTNPAGRATSRLDRIFVRGFSVQSARIPSDGPQWAQRSDHLPVFASLEPT